MSVRSLWVRKFLEQLGGRKRGAPSKGQRKSGLGVEVLEGRDVPATIDLTGTTLTYTAGAGINNNISVTVSGSNFVFADTAEAITTGIAGAANSGTNSVSVPTASVTGVTLNLGNGANTISSTGVIISTQALNISSTGTTLVLTGALTTTTGTITVSNTGTGALTQAGAITSTSGNVSVSSNNAYTLNANVNAGSGTVTLRANQDGAGTESFAQNATAATSTITTTNTTAGAVLVQTNTSTGGTGNASLRTINATGGTLTVQSFGGSILYAGTDAMTAFQAAQTALAPGLLGPQADGGAAPTGTINAKTYLLSATGAGSIGTAARPIQTLPNVDNNVTLTAGSGGAYFVNWGGASSPVSTLAGATATGAGNVVVVTAASGGHNLTVTGNISTGSGNIVLAADDNFVANASATIGGAGFSGAVYMAGNRDAGNTGTLTMSGTILTTNTSASAVVLESFHAANDGTSAGTATVNNITVGNGGTITVSTVPSSLATGQGIIQMSNATAVLNAGANGTVRLIAASVNGNASNTNLIGSAATPMKVTAGNVVITAKAGTGSTTSIPPTPVFVTDTIAGNFTVTTTGAGGTINLATTSGALTIAGATNTTNGSAITLTGAGGVVVNAALGSATTGAININGPLSGSGDIATGTGAVTVTQASDSTFAGNITGPQGLVKAGAGNLTLTGTVSFTGSALVNAGTLTVIGQVTATSGVNIAAGATLDGTGAVGPVTVTGTVSPGASQGGILSAGNVSFASGGTYAAQVLGAALGAGSAGYDQLDVTGTVDLTGGVLNLTSVTSSAVPPAAPLVIIKNDGTDAVVGTFTGAAEGATVSFGGVDFTISYVGGDGNDVTLTRQSSGTFYVDDDFASLTPGVTITDADPVAPGAQSAVFGTTAFASVADAIASANVTDFASLIVNQGSYSAVVLSKPLTLTLQQGPIAFASLADAAVPVLSGLNLNGVALTVGSDGSSTTFSGAINGTGRLVKTGTGTLTVTTTNGYTGGTTVSAGTLVAGATNAFGNGGPLRVDAGSALRLGGFDQSFGNVSGAGSITNDTGTATLTFNTTADSAFTGALTQTGPGVLGLVKNGSATLSLTGANAYEGATAVNAGTLVLIGTPSGAVSVAAGATLAGTASVGPTAVSGQLAPGAPGGTGAFGTGNLSFSSGSTLTIEANNTTAGSGYDQVSVTGTVNLTGATLRFTPPNGMKFGDRLTIIANDGTDAVTGGFANIPGGTFWLDGLPYLFVVDTTGGDGNDVDLVVASDRYEVDEDSAAFNVDLSNLQPGSGVSYSLAQTNSSGLLFAGINGTTLTVTPAPDRYGYSYLRVTATAGARSFTGYIQVIVRAADDLTPDNVAPGASAIDINVLDNDGAPDQVRLAEAGNLHVAQNDTGNTTASVTLTFEQGTPNLSAPVVGTSLPNRGDFGVKIGPSSADDLAGGLFFSTSRENGRDNGEATGIGYAVPAIEWDATNNITYLSVNRSGDNAEWNEDQAVAYFPYAQGWLAAWINNSAGTNGGANNRLFTAAPNGGFSLTAGSILDQGSGNTRVTIPGVNSQTDGLLLAIHGKNEANYALVQANPDGSWQTIVKDDSSDGAGSEQDPVAFVFIPRNMPNVVSGRLMGDGSVQLSSGNFTLSKTGTGTYTLNVPGQTPQTGVLVLSAEGNAGPNVDNIVSYQASGSDFVIQTRDINGAGPALEDVGANVPVASFAFIPFLNVPTTRITSVQSPSGTVSTSAEGATLSINADGTVHYDPSSVPNYAARVAAGTFSDSFTYTTTTLNGATSTTTVTISQPATTPAVTDATANEDTQTASGLVISAGTSFGDGTQFYKITGITNGTLFLNDGSTPVSNGDFITREQGEAGLKFTPAPNFFGTGSFQVQASNSNNDAGLGGSLITANVTVNPVADTPAVTDATTAEDTQTTSGLVITPNAVDGTEVTHFMVTGITGGALFLNDGVTQVSEGSFITVADGADGLKFTPAPNFFGAATFQVQASLSASEAGLGVNTVTATITVTPVNDDPVIGNLSGSIAYASGSQPIFVASAATATDPDLADFDGGTLTVQPMAGQTTDQYSIGTTASIATSGSDVLFNGVVVGTLVGGNGPNGLVVTFNASATTAAVEAILRAVTFVNLGASPSTITRQATYTITDGDGGTSSTATRGIVITFITPLVANATTDEDTPTSGGLVVTANAADGGATTHYKVTGITGGTLFLNDGITQVTDGSFITVADGAMGLKFVPALNFNGTASFQVQASTSASDAGLGGSVVQATVTVNPVNDAPVNTVPVTTPTVVAQRTITITEISVSDVDAGAGTISVTASVPTGFGTFAAVNGGGVTVSGSGTEAVVLSGTVADISAFIAGGGLGYTAPLTVGSVTVTVVSDDGGNTGASGPLTDTDTFTIDVAAQPMVSLSVAPAAIPENGGTATLTATLSATSTVDVIVTVAYTGTAANGSDYTAATTITIPAGQLFGTVTISALDDTTIESNETVTASITSADFATPAGTTATVTITDNDTVTVSIVRDANSPTNATSVSWTVTFSKPVSGVDLADFTLTANGVTFAGSSAIPVGGTSPSTVWTFTVSGIAGDGTLDLDFTAPTGVTPAVVASFDGPAYTIDQTAPTANITASPPALSNSSTVSFSFTGNDPVVNGVSSGVARFEVSLDGTAFTTQTSPVTFTNLAEGSHTFQVRTIDAVGNVGGAVNYPFTVDAVNAAPSVTLAGNQTSNEDAGPQTVSNFATGFDPGSPEESGQTAASYTVTLVTTGTLAFTAAPAIAPDGTLTYTATPNTNGTATVTATVTDSGGATSATQTFTITVNAVNDAPSLTPGADPTVPQNSGAQTVPGFAAFAPGGGADEIGQTPTYSVANNNNALFSVQPGIAPDGTLTFTPAPGANGVATVTVTVTDDGGTANGGVATSLAKTFLINVEAPQNAQAPIPPSPAPAPAKGGSAATAQFIAIGTDAGTPGMVRVLNATTRALVRDVVPFGPFAGGIRVALGDTNGDGKDDLIVATATQNSHVKVYDLATGAELRSFFAFPGFTGGVDIAAGDVNGDGKADIVVGTATQNSHVKVFDGATGGELMSFFAFPGFTGGVKVAAGDINGDGKADVAVLAGPGGNGHIKVFDGATGSLITSFLGYSGYLGDIDLAVGDANGDGVAEVITSAQNPAAGTHIKAFNQNAQTVRSFFAPTSAGATFQRSDQFPVPIPGTTARVGVADFTGDKVVDYLLGSQPSAGASKVLLIDGATGATMVNEFAFDPVFGYGIFVA